MVNKARGRGCVVMSLSFCLIIYLLSSCSEGGKERKKSGFLDDAGVILDFGGETPLRTVKRGKR